MRFAPPDRALCQELVYGMVRWQAHAGLAGRAQNRRAARKTPPLRLLLHLGLYQLFWLQRIPDHAAVHETVELGKRLGFGPQAGFLNAVLRGYIRATRRRPAPLWRNLKQTDPAAGLFPSRMAGRTMAGALGPRDGRCNCCNGTTAPRRFTRG